MNGMKNVFVALFAMVLLATVSFATDATKQITAYVLESNGAQAQQASVNLFYTDSDDGRSDLSGTATSGHGAKFDVQVNRPFKLNGYNADYSQYYGEANGVPGAFTKVYIVKMVSGVYQLCGYTDNQCTSSLSLTLYANRPTEQPKPDLVITHLSYDADSTGDGVCDSFVINFKNQGNGELNTAVTATVKINGVQKYTGNYGPSNANYFPVSSGESFIDRVFYSQLGAHASDSIEITIDSSNAASESNENNNVLSGYLPVSAASCTLPIVAPTYPSTANSAFSIFVYGQNNERISNALVAMDRSSDGGIITSATTDSNGEAKFYGSQFPDNTNIFFLATKDGYKYESITPSLRFVDTGTTAKGFCQVVDGVQIRCNQTGYALTKVTAPATPTVQCTAPHGNDIYTKGLATGLDYYGTQTITSSDYCAATNGGAQTSTGAYVVKEQCDSANKVHSQYYACPSGYSCSDGACVQQAVEPTTQRLSVTVIGSDGNPVANYANVYLYYSDESNSVADISRSTGNAGTTGMDVAINRPFFLDGYNVNNVNQKYGKANGASGEGTKKFIIKKVGANYELCGYYDNECTSVLSVTLYANQLGTTTPAANTGTFTLFVRDPNGGFATGVDVSMYRRSDSALLATHTSDTSGKVVFTALEIPDNTQVYFAGNLAGYTYGTDERVTVTFVDSGTATDGYCRYVNAAKANCNVVQYELKQVGTPANAYLSCSETDNGDNPYKKGSMTYAIKTNGVTTSATVDDYCVDSTSVEEYYCVGQTSHKYVAYCPNGYSCKEGACVQQTTTTATGYTVKIGVGVNNYPDTNNYATTKNIDGYVNIYKVSPVSSGVYKGYLIETKKAPSDTGAIFTLAPGQVVDFVGFKSLDAAKAATEWTFSSPPYRNFGDYSDRICQINYLDTSQKLVLGDGSYSCATSLGEPYSDSGTSTPVTVPTESTYTLQLSQGWNMLSVPMVGAQVVSNDCGSNTAFVYDGVSYKKVDISQGSTVGFNFAGFWVKYQGPTGQCKITLKSEGLGMYYAKDIERLVTNNGAGSYKLHAGWNLVGAPYDGVEISSIKGACDIKSGPWYYGGGQWSKSSVLKSGLGYFIKVANDCILGSGEVPPAPPN